MYALHPSVITFIIICTITNVNLHQRGSVSINSLPYKYTKLVGTFKINKYPGNVGVLRGCTIIILNCNRIFNYVRQIRVNSFKNFKPLPLVLQITCVSSISEFNILLTKKHEAHSLR